MIIEDFITSLEEPVKQAVIVMLKNGEPTGSSGFHHFLNQKWGIVFNGYPSELVIEAAWLNVSILPVGLDALYYRQKNRMATNQASKRPELPPCRLVVNGSIWSTFSAFGKGTDSTGYI